MCWPWGGALVKFVLEPSERCALPLGLQTVVCRSRTVYSRTVNFSFVADLYYKQNRYVVKASILKKNPLWSHFLSISPFPLIADDRYDLTVLVFSTRSSLLYYLRSPNTSALSNLCFVFSSHFTQSLSSVWCNLYPHLFFLYAWSALLSSPLRDPSVPVFPSAPVSDLESLLYVYEFPVFKHHLPFDTTNTIGCPTLPTLHLLFKIWYT